MAQDLRRRSMAISTENRLQTKPSLPDSQMLITLCQCKFRQDLVETNVLELFEQRWMRLVMPLPDSVSGCKCRQIANHFSQWQRNPCNPHSFEHASARDSRPQGFLEEQGLVQVAGITNCCWS
jgi:hypothetical protein